MNWTEGSLARHSRRGKNAELVARQKKYFAKARSGFFQPPGSKAGPPNISFLPSPTPGVSSKQTPHNGLLSSVSHHGFSGSSSSSNRNDSNERMTKDTGRILQQAGNNDPFHVPYKRRHDQKICEADDILYIHEKRRRLLEEGDWTGLARQKLTTANTFEYRPKSRMRGWSKQAQSPRPVSVLRKEANQVRQRVLRLSSDPSQKKCEPAYSIHIGSQQSQIQYRSPAKTQSRPDRVPLLSSSRSLSEHSLNSLYNFNQIPAQAVEPFQHNTCGLIPQMPQGPIAQEPTRSNNTAFSRPPSVDSQLPRITYSSSVIHGPLPRHHTDNCSAVLNWSPPQVHDIPSSIQVEIGRISNDVSPRQQEDHVHWKTWLDQWSVSQHCTSPSLPPLASISPGVSALPSLMAHELPAFDSFHDEQARDLSRVASTGEDSTYYPLKAPMPVRHDSKGLALACGKVSDPHPSVVAPDHMNVSKKRHGLAGTTRQRQSTEDSENQNWMNFLFEDNSSEIMNEALEATTAQAARTAWQAGHILPETPPKLATDCSTLEISPLATCGTSNSKSSANVVSDTPDATEPPAVSAVPPALSSSYPPASVRHMSTIVETSSPDEDQSAQKTVFTVPSMFVGKFASTGLEACREARQPPVPQHTMNGKQKRRRKKKALDGRPEIRDLPDFDDDPIEEF
ncbi:hypothetical protein MN608_08139 [Microdochium nivale]|nr:hypothetical protein MN608_08139 [Microdochium nivale]